METRKQALTLREFPEYPGLQKISQRIEGEEERSVIRKPDGAYWDYSVDILPRAGGLNLHKLTKQITDEKELAVWAKLYNQLLEDQTRERAKRAT
ncbi:MAG: hypothetical protein M3O85_00300 [Acidobacteriota bacterium]|nr:hypothetical protein [Acidobacteriota bacterium]